MVNSVDDLNASRSIHGDHFPDFEMLAKIASALGGIVQSSYFMKKVSLEEHEAQLQDRFLPGRQIVFMIYEYFRVTRTHYTVLDYADLFSITLRNGTMTIRTDDALESLYKLRIRECAQLKTVLE